MTKKVQTKKDLVLRNLTGKRTANEVIQKIFEIDMEKGSRFVVKERGWKFYVQLNKHFSQLEKSGVIKNIGLKDGEKLWIKLK